MAFCNSGFINSHSYYFYCGKNSPFIIIEAAISGSIELFGINDHNHGVEAHPNDYGMKKIAEHIFDKLSLNL
jgi:hypothetical protein